MSKFHYILTCILSALLITSCGREALDYNKEELIEAGEGQLSFSQFNVNVATQARNTRAVDMNNYTVTLYDATNKAINTWTYKDIPQVLNLTAGKYYISVISHEMKQLDTVPYYAGKSNEFEIKVGEITEIEPIICTLGVIEVKVSFEDKLVSYMNNPQSTTVEILLDKNVIYKYSGVTDCPPIYIAPDKGETTIITAIFNSTIDGSLETTTTTRDLVAGDSFQLDYSIKVVDTDGTIADLGTMSPTLRIISQGIIKYWPKNLDDIVEEVIPEGGDEDKLPYIEGDGFNIAKEQIIPDGGMICKVNINAPYGIAHLKVRIDSPTLTPAILSSVGLAAEFDLAYPGSLEEGLKGLKFPVGNEVIGATKLIFDISQFTGLIPPFDKGVEHSHKFILMLEDVNGNGVTKTLTLVSSRK